MKVTKPDDDSHVGTLEAGHSDLSSVTVGGMLITHDLFADGAVLFDEVVKTPQIKAPDDSEMISYYDDGVVCIGPEEDSKTNVKVSQSAVKLHAQNVDDFKSEMSMNPYEIVNTVHITTGPNNYNTYAETKKPQLVEQKFSDPAVEMYRTCLLYTSDAADE